jgi:CHRD domain-containing protein
MKARNAIIGLIVSALAAGIVISCGGGSGGGGGGTPAVASGTGRGALVVDTGTGEVTGSIFFSGLSGTPTSVGLYQGAAGANANPNTSIFDLDLFTGTATVPPNKTLTNPQITALQANGLYFLVKTSTFPNGEIRGQISGTAGMTAGVVSLDNAQEVPATTGGATGRGTIVVNSTTGQIIAGAITYTGLTTNAILSHIHVGAAGTNGGIRVNFNPSLTTVGTATVLDPAVPMDPALDLPALGAGNLYFNVHTVMFGGGEIRGQIATTTTQDVRSADLTTAQVVP